MEPIKVCTAVEVPVEVAGQRAVDAVQERHSVQHGREGPIGGEVRISGGKRKSGSGGAVAGSPRAVGNFQVTGSQERSDDIQSKRAVEKPVEGGHPESCRCLEGAPLSGAQLMVMTLRSGRGEAQRRQERKRLKAVKGCQMTELLVRSGGAEILKRRCVSLSVQKTQTRGDVPILARSREWRRCGSNSKVSPERE